MEFSYNNTLGIVNEETLTAMTHKIIAAHDAIHEKTGYGNEFLGWADLPINYNKAEFLHIKRVSKKIRENSDVLIVIGIGGSYIGTRAAIEFLRLPLHNLTQKPQIFYVGNNFSPNMLNEILRIVEDKDISVNVISKSGAGLEPTIAFTVFHKFMERKYGKKGARDRIYITTDPQKGIMRELSTKEGYESFSVPRDIGGRYSVLTAVGLLPMAVVGCDINALMKGAADAQIEFSKRDIESNICYQYAAARNILYNGGNFIEILANYEPSLHYILEWWKQLFGESEGKNGKGIFPASVDFSTDLHSLGQYIQDGSRILFETIISINKPITDMNVEIENGLIDRLDFLNGKSLYAINNTVLQGTMLAHNEGGVPNLLISIDKQDEYNLGYLLYFFMKACAISGYILGVNPFDQPGVEAYKNHVYKLLKEK